MSNHKRKSKQALVSLHPDEEYRLIQEHNKNVAEKIAVADKPICPHCGNNATKAAGKTKAKYSPRRDRRKCVNCERSFTIDDKRYANLHTEYVVWQQAALAAMQGPEALKAVAKKAEQIGEQHFFNWENSTTRRFFKGVAGSR